MPALREREGDVALLTRHFLHQFIREIPSLRGRHPSQGALDMLCAYSFPGYARELKNIVERAAYRGNTGEITPGDVGILSGEGNGAGGTLNILRKSRGVKGRPDQKSPGRRQWKPGHGRPFRGAVLSSIQILFAKVYSRAGSFIGR